MEGTGQEGKNEGCQEKGEGTERCFVDERAPKLNR
jgi:hypothetical protein